MPLDERALAGLAHSAMALDIYAWLAQRLHRIARRSQFITWAALKDQFGQDYLRTRKFREVFSVALEKAYSLFSICPSVDQHCNPKHRLGRVQGKRSF